MSKNNRKQEETTNALAGPERNSNTVTEGQMNPENHISDKQTKGYRNSPQNLNA